MIKILEKLLDLIYIQPCLICHSIKEDKIICSKCYKKIRFMPKGVFRQEKGVNVYACTIYDGVIKQLIKEFKYYNKKRLGKLMAELMFQYWKELNIQGEFTVIPVPIHKNRRKERKYNHMDITGEELSKLTNYKINKNFLIRIKDTQKQYKLHKSERIKNIKDAFSINLSENIEQSENLLIIDDITSTGITVEEIVKLLKNNGYNHITVLTLSTPDIWN